MQTYIEFAINGTEYWAHQNNRNDSFSWSNGRNEEGRDCASLLEAQQDAMAWESGRRARYEGSEAEAEAARNRYLNQRCDDKRGA